MAVEPPCEPTLASSLGNTLYFALSGLGVGAILIASHEVFAVIKYVGAAYLVYLGVQTFRGRGIGPHVEQEAGSITNGWRMLARGFLRQTANAKSLLFFVALLPQFVDARGSFAGANSP